MPTGAAEWCKCRYHMRCQIIPPFCAGVSTKLSYQRAQILSGSKLFGPQIPDAEDSRVKNCSINMQPPGTALQTIICKISDRLYGGTPKLYHKKRPVIANIQQGWLRLIGRLACPCQRVVIEINGSFATVIASLLGLHSRLMANGSPELHSGKMTQNFALRKMCL